MIKYIILACLLVVAACGETVPKAQFVRVATEPLPRPNLNIPAVDQLNPRPTEWIVITPANADEVFAKLQAEGTTPTVFGLTEQGYKNLTLNNSEQMKVILQQQAVIYGYRKYYIQADGIIYEYNQRIAETDYWTQTYPNGTPRPSFE